MTGEIWLDHYEKHLGKPAWRRVFRDPDFEYSIQVLAYENVIEGCVVFATLGLARFLSSAFEMVCPVDGLFDEIPHVLANAGFSIAKGDSKLAAGGYISGLGNASPAMAQKFGKESALYMCSPYILPPDFAGFRFGGVEARCLFALPIYDGEMAYLKNFGRVDFERHLESLGVDLFSVTRCTSV
jgi:hypothetical protein